MKSRSKSRADAALALGLGAFFLFQLIASWRYPAPAALFPRIVGTIGVVFAIVVALGALRGRTATHFKTEALDRGALGVALAAPVVYGIGLWLFGYWIASLLALVAFPLLVGYRRPVLVTITAIVTTALFGALLHFMEVRLPVGALVDRIVG